MNNKNKLPIIGIIVLVPIAQAQSSDWALTVNINNVNFGESTIGVNVKGPFGYTDSQTVANGPSPTATFTIPGSAVPVGSNYQVCAGTGHVGAVLPHCQMFTHGHDADSQVTVTP
jgi:hypothetical protein